jgi:hypothetical protein
VPIEIRAVTVAKWVSQTRLSKFGEAATR